MLTRRDEQQASEVCSFYYRPSVAYLRYADRHTVLSWDRTHRPPRPSFRPAPPPHLPRRNDLQGLPIGSSWVWKLYYASPAESRRPVAPLVKCGESWCSDVYHRASCSGCRRGAGGYIGCLALLAPHLSLVSVVFPFLSRRSFTRATRPRVASSAPSLARTLRLSTRTSRSRCAPRSRRRFPLRLALGAAPRLHRAAPLSRCAVALAARVVAAARVVRSGRIALHRRRGATSRHGASRHSQKNSSSLPLEMGTPGPRTH